jgi:hypothetical protein
MSQSYIPGNPFRIRSLLQRPWRLPDARRPHRRVAAPVPERGAPQDERPRHGQGQTGNQSPGRHRPDKSEDPEKNPEVILLKEFGAEYYPGPFRPIDVRQSGLWVDVVPEDPPDQHGRDLPALHQRAAVRQDACRRSRPRKNWRAGTGLNRRHQDFQSWNTNRGSTRQSLPCNHEVIQSSCAQVLWNDQECADEGHNVGTLFCIT